MEYGYRYQADTATQILAQESARAFMAKVYRWMFGGLALTGLIAMYVATQRDLAILVAKNAMPLLVVELGAVFGLSFFARKMSGAMAGLVFLLYAALNGLTFSGIFFVYHLGTVANAFFLTAAVFGAMSFYGTVTKKDLSAWSGFLYGGLIGILGAMVLSFFIHSSMLEFVINCACVVVFSGLAAYDNQKLRKIHASSGYSSAGSLAVVGALNLYLDFINLFLAILQLMGGERSK